MKIGCFSPARFVWLFVLACNFSFGQVFNPAELLKPEYRKPKDRLFYLLQEERLDSAFLISAHLLNLSSCGKFSDEQFIDTYTTVSKALSKLGSRNLGLQYANKALEAYLHKGFSTSEYLVGLWSLKAGLQHENKSQAQETIRLYRKVRKWNLSNNRLLGASSTLNNIGLVYLKTGALDSASHYFLKARDEFEAANLPFNEFVFSLNNNLARVAFLQNRLNESYALYHTNYQLAHSSPLGIKPIDLCKRKVTSAIGMMQVLLKQKQLKPIDSLLAHAKAHMARLDFSRANPLIDELCTIECEFYLQNGDLENFNKVLQHKEHFMDSIAQLKTDKIALFLEEMISLQLASGKDALQAQQVEADYRFRQNTLLYIVIIGALVTVALIIGLQLSNTARHKQKIENEKKLAEIALQNSRLKKEKLKLQLQSQGKDIGELSSQLLLMRKISREAQQKLKAMKALKKEDQLTEMQNLSGLFTRTVSESKVKTVLQQHLDKVNSEFYEKLSAQSSQKLTRAEMEVCAMQRLNMDDHQIAELRGTTQNAVQVSRYRIRKKLGLNKDTSLDDFLKNL